MYALFFAFAALVSAIPGEAATIVPQCLSPGSCANSDPRTLDWVSCLPTTTVSISPLFFLSFRSSSRETAVTRLPMISRLPDCQPSPASGGEGALGCPAMGRWMGRSRSPVPSPASHRRKLYLIGRLVPPLPGPRAKGQGGGDRPCLPNAHAHAHFDFTSSIFLQLFPTSIEVAC